MAPSEIITPPVKTSATWLHHPPGFHRGWRGELISQLQRINYQKKRQDSKTPPPRLGFFAETKRKPVPKKKKQNSIKVEKSKIRTKSGKQI